jgi:hypothetical protein
MVSTLNNSTNQAVSLVECPIRIPDDGLKTLKRRNAMKTAFVVGCWIVLVGGAISGQNGAASLDSVVPHGVDIGDPRSLDRCDFGQVIEALIVSTGIGGGFENHPSCWLSRRARAASQSATISVGGMTVRQALDLITRQTDFKWKDIKGQAVVRPVSAWAEMAHLLNRPISPFTAEGPVASVAVPALLQSSMPSLFVPFRREGHEGPRIDRRVVLEFEGGTLLDALVTLVAAHGDLAWSLGYRQNTLPGLLLYAVSAPDQFVGVPLKDSRQ